MCFTLHVWCTQVLDSAIRRAIANDEPLDRLSSDKKDYTPGKRLGQQAAPSRPRGPALYPASHHPTRGLVSRKEEGAFDLS